MTPSALRVQVTGTCPYSGEWMLPAPVLSVSRVVEDANTDTRILVLTRTDDQDTFMIWVGAPEGDSIRRALDSATPPRPMSHDLVKSFGEHFGITTKRVVLTDVKSSTYYATVFLENKGVERSIDARPSDAIALAQRMLEAIAVPFTVNGHATVITASIGISVAPKNGETGAVLLKSADAALLRAKEAGRNTFRFYDEAMNRRANRCRSPGRRQSADPGRRR